MKNIKVATLFILLILFSCFSLFGQSIPSPKEHFGFSIGDDYSLPNFTETEAYFKKLAAASDRVKLVECGLTEEGRQQPMLVISSPKNILNLERYKEIARELALAQNPNEEYAKKLAEEGKAVVMLNGGLHASENLGINQLIETAWQLASRDDRETLNILENVIVLLMHANPDGQELVANWYNRRSNPKSRVRDNPPFLYQKYVGHDVNRDFYINNLKETKNINRQMYIEWFPQIVLDAHQGGDQGLPLGTIVSTIPFRDPFNYYFDPLVVAVSENIGGAMHSRWIEEGKPGSNMRYGSAFTAWANGSLSIAPYFHNMIGILTETGGSPTPVQIPLMPNRQLLRANFPWPAPPQIWHFRQSVEYSITANYAILDYAVRNRDKVLFNIYKMGRNSIEKGSRDNWTYLPSRIEEMKKASSPDKSGRINPSLISIMHKPKWKDARAYIITSDATIQSDRGNVAKFINALSSNGVEIHRATAPFTLNKITYPKDSYVVKSAQACRPHILDMFEPQDYPTDFITSATTNSVPYDVAGYTLALQMGIIYERIVESIPDNLPLEALPLGEEVLPIPGVVSKTDSVVGWLISHRSNNSFKLTNRLLKSDASVYWLYNKPGVQRTVPGTLFVPADSKSAPIVESGAKELGVDAMAVSELPVGIPSLKLRPTRIALWDRYVGSVPAGWVRWILEQFEYDFELIYVNEIDDVKNLNKKFDIIIFANDAIPPRASDKLPPPRRSPHPSFQPPKENIPKEYHHLLGHITGTKTIPALKRFLEEGGSIVTIGSSTSLAYYLDLPVTNALLETLPNGTQRLYRRDKFYIPGSILKAQFDPNLPVAWGMYKSGPIYFDRSPLFGLTTDATAKGVQVAGWLSGDDYLLSGLAWDKRNVKGSALVLEAPVGKGRLYLLAPEVTFRGQSHATFKLLFNPIHLSTAYEYEF